MPLVGTVLWKKLRYRKGDPLRDLHVPKRERVTVDEGPDSAAIVQPFDRDEVRSHDEVVPLEDLQ